MLAVIQTIKKCTETSFFWPVISDSYLCLLISPTPIFSITFVTLLFYTQEILKVLFDQEADRYLYSMNVLCICFFFLMHLQLFKLFREKDRQKFVNTWVRGMERGEHTHKRVVGTSGSWKIPQGEEGRFGDLFKACSSDPLD